MIEILLGKNLPRSQRKLHHRHQRLQGAGAHKELLVNRESARRIAAAISTGYHIRNRECVAAKTGGLHFRNDVPQILPPVQFVHQTQNERLAAALVTAADFVVGELCGDPSILFYVIDTCLFRTIEADIHARCEQVLVSGVEFQTVYAILGEERLKLIYVIVSTLRVGQIIHRRYAAPPANNRRARPLLLMAEQIKRSCLLMVPQTLVLARIRRNEMGGPHKRLPPLIAYFRKHSLRIGKIRINKRIAALMRHIAAVHHIDTARKTVIGDLFRIILNRLLGGAADIQLYPVVELRLLEKLRRRHTAVGTEVAA